MSEVVCRGELGRQDGAEGTYGGVKVEITDFTKVSGRGWLGIMLLTSDDRLSAGISPY